MQNVLKLQMFGETGPGACENSQVSCPSLVSCPSYQSSNGDS